MNLGLWIFLASKKDSLLREERLLCLVVWMLDGMHYGLYYCCLGLIDYGLVCLLKVNKLLLRNKFKYFKNDIF